MKKSAVQQHNKGINIMSEMVKSCIKRKGQLGITSDDWIIEIINDSKYRISDCPAVKNPIRCSETFECCNVIGKVVDSVIYDLDNNDIKLLRIKGINASGVSFFDSPHHKKEYQILLDFGLTFNQKLETMLLPQMAEHSFITKMIENIE